MPKKQVASDKAEDTETAAVASDEAKNEVDSPAPKAKAPKAEKPQVADAVAENTAHVAKGSKAEAMRDKLAAEPKVRVLVPLANGEKAGVTQSVILNGYSLYIRKGEYVMVPESVAEVLDIKMKHKMDVENHPDRVTGDRPVKMTTYGS